MAMIFGATMFGLALTRVFVGSRLSLAGLPVSRFRPDPRAISGHGSASCSWDLVVPAGSSLPEVSRLGISEIRSSR